MPEEIPDLPEEMPRFESEFEEVHEEFEIPSREEEVYETPERVLPSRSFVAVQDYKKIVDESNVVRGKLMEAEGLLKGLKDVRDHEERLFGRWRSHVEQIEKKLTHVDQVLANAQR